jgi:hypothetical protein
MSPTGCPAGWSSCRQCNNAAARHDGKTFRTARSHLCGRCSRGQQWGGIRSGITAEPVTHALGYKRLRLCDKPAQPAAAILSHSQVAPTRGRYPCSTPSVPLSRDRFWDIQVAKIDSPTQQPMCPGRPASATLGTKRLAQLPQWLYGARMCLSHIPAGCCENTWRLPATIRLGLRPSMADSERRIGDCPQSFAVCPYGEASTATTSARPPVTRARPV